MVLSFKSVDEIPKSNHSNKSYLAVPSYLLSLWIKSENVTASVTIQMKANEQYFPMVPFIMLHKVVLTFESVDEILSVTIQIKAFDQ